MQNKIQIITNENKIYPEKLRRIPKSPQKLYLNGNIELLNNNSVAIVGSRKCSDYAKNVANKIAKELGENGVTVISGLAVRCRHTSTFRLNEFSRKNNSCFRMWY